MIKIQSFDKELYKKYKAIPLENDNKWSQLVRKWIFKLGLQKEHIRVLYEQKGENVFTINKVAWNPLNNNWEIQYKYPLDEYTIIHELGHIYLYKLDGDLAFYKNRELKIAKNKQLAIDINILEDSFVDYELCKYPEFNEIFKIKTVNRRNKLYLFYTLPKSINRVEYIRKVLYRTKKHSKKEINDFLKQKYGKLYK